MKKIEPDLLEKAIQKLVSALHPEKIYLYGYPYENSKVFNPEGVVYL